VHSPDGSLLVAGLLAAKMQPSAFPRQQLPFHLGAGQRETLAPANE
jgi:hypothetical protein